MSRAQREDIAAAVQYADLARTFYAQACVGGAVEHWHVAGATLDKASDRITHLQNLAHPQIDGLMQLRDRLREEAGEAWVRYLGLTRAAARGP